MTPQVTIPLTPLRRNQRTLPVELLQQQALQAPNSKDSHARIIAEAVNKDRDVKRKRWYTSRKKRHLRVGGVPPTKPR